MNCCQKEEFQPMLNNCVLSTHLNHLLEKTHTLSKRITDYLSTKTFENPNIVDI